MPTTDTDRDRVMAPARADEASRSRAARVWRVSEIWRAGDRAARTLAAHADPLAEASNWVALAIGSHLPLWPLYVWWSAGNQAFPTGLLTAAMTPVFLAIPLLSRRSSLLGRVAMLVAGIFNTVFTIWILGMSSGTALFLAPCAGLAALSFRRGERWVMLALTLLPLITWFALLGHAPPPLHRYDAVAAGRLFGLNAISVAVLAALFGWLQGEVYRRMERK